MRLRLSRLLAALNGLRLSEAKWDAAYVDSLPDSAFAYVESDKKDADGNTLKSARHLPFKDKDGKVDLPHLRNALARLKQTDIPAAAKAAAAKKLAAAAKQAGVGDSNKKVKEGQARLFREGAPMSYENRRDEIRETLCELFDRQGAPGPDTPRYWSIIATFDDSVIVSVDDDLYEYPLSWDDAGECTLGDPQEVEVAYQPVAVQESRGSGMLLGLLLEEGEGAKPGSRWLVACVVEGLSANKVLYSADVLRTAAPLYEGAKVFWNHVGVGAATPPMRDPRDIAGFIRGAQFANLTEGASAGSGAVVGILHATDPKLRERLLEAHEAGNPDLFGLSHTVFADVEKVRLAEGAAHRAKSIKAVESVDVVSFPSAGGRVMRLVAGLSSPVELTEEGLVNFEQMLAKLREGAPDLAAGLSATPGEAEVAALFRVMEARRAATATPPATASAAVVATAATAATPATAPGMSADDRAILIEARVDRHLKGRTLPEPMLEPTRATMIALYEAGASQAAVLAFLEGQVAAAARIVEAKVTGAGGRIAESATIESDEAEKITYALDGFFSGQDECVLGADGKATSKKIPRLRSIKEAYIQLTGDHKVIGVLRDASRLASVAKAAHVREAILVREGVGSELIMEGLATGSFTNVLASSLNRQLVREYNADGSAYGDTGKGWLYTTIPANDFRNRERVRFGGYGNLPTVSEQNTYPALTSPTDEKSTYAVSKRGGMETITLEMIKNDDVGLVQRIPKRMAMAARRTFYEFAHDLYRTNPSIYDSVTLGHANHGGNLGTGALAKATYSAARLVMLKQTEKDSLKRLGLILRHLMVPPDLEEVANNLFKMIAAGANPASFEPDFLAQQAKAQIHVVTHASDTNDWFACAGVDQTEQIEIGFLDGREDPEIFVADLPNAGSLFTADKIDYKIRHIYGGSVLDFRGFYIAIVP